MEEEIISQIQNHKVDEEELDANLDNFSIEQFLLDEFDSIDELYNKLEYKYHGLKAKREARYGT